MELTQKALSAGSLASAGSSVSSRQSMQHGGAPELMLGLAYNESTGRLSVEVIKGSNFKNLASAKAPGAAVVIVCVTARTHETLLPSLGAANFYARSVTVSVVIKHTS